MTVSGSNVFSFESIGHLMVRSENLTGALLMMASMAAFTLNDVLMKAMAGEVSLSQLMFLRGIVTTVIVAFIAWKMGVLVVRPARGDRWLLLLRMAAEIGASYFFLTALFSMPIANVTAILQALPLTITLAAAIVLKEPVGWRRLVAIAVGFIGVMLIVRPGATDFTASSLYALVAICFVTIRDLSTRRLSSATPSMFVTLSTSVSIMVFFGVVSLVAGEWVEMDLRNSVLISGAALMIIGGYLCSVMVMRVGEISFIAPFRYTGLVWALLLGWLVFGEWPDTLTLIGAAIVVGSGMFMLYREALLGRRKQT